MNVSLALPWEDWQYKLSNAVQGAPVWISLFEEDAFNNIFLTDLSSFMKPFLSRISGVGAITSSADNNLATSEASGRQELLLSWSGTGIGCEIQFEWQFSHQLDISTLSPEGMILILGIKSFEDAHRNLKRFPHVVLEIEFNLSESWLSLIKSSTHSFIWMNNSSGDLFDDDMIHNHKKVEEQQRGPF